jgi:DnaK suppressor protein
MSDPSFAELRQWLADCEARLQLEVQRHRTDLAEPAADTGNAFIAGNEGAMADADDELELALLRRAQHELGEVSAALQRMEAGTYGDCQRCAEPIGLARLRALPEARLCLACQQLADQGSRAA